MKKALSVLLTIALLCSICSIAASADDEAYEDGTVYTAFAYGDPNWSAVYISDNSSLDAYTASNLGSAVWDGSQYKMFLPDATGTDDIYANLYLNAGDMPGRNLGGTGTGRDLGMCFTAPETGLYRLDFSFRMVYDAPNTDGQLIRLFDNDFNHLEDVVITNAGVVFSKVYPFNAGDKFYIFFNKNGHIYSDQMSVSEFGFTRTYSLKEYSFSTASISLQESTTINFYTDLTAMEIGTYHATVSMDGSDEMEVPITEKGGRYRVCFAVKAPEYTNDITARLYNNDNEMVSEKTLSVRTYAETLLAKEDTAQTYVDLLRAMLNYGAAAQIHFNVKTGNLANKNLT